MRLNIEDAFWFHRKGRPSRLPGYTTRAGFLASAIDRDIDRLTFRAIVKCGYNSQANPHTRLERVAALSGTRTQERRLYPRGSSQGSGSVESCRDLCCVDLDHLEVELTLAIRQVRGGPDLIQSFFAGAGLDF